MSEQAYTPIASSYDRRGNLRGSMLEEAFSLNMTGKKRKLPDRMALLGIPDDEMSESVMLALSALFEKLDDSHIELRQAKEQLQELESLVDVDFLAPIPNRRAFMRRLSWVISMVDRYNHPSSIVFFDLNGFKAINDTYGHAAGDMAIRHVADLLCKSKRESDFLARLGGDEFALILYYAEEGAAQKRGAAIAEKILSTPFIYNGQPLRISSAFGTHILQRGESPEEALAAADKAMYANKRDSKNMFLTTDA